MSTTGIPLTVAEALGQVTWLFSQSLTHKQLRIADLETAVMPALMHEQFRVFRFGPLKGLAEVQLKELPIGFDVSSLEQMPLGVAFWGFLSAEAEAKLEKGEQLAFKDWKSGDRLWLLELITPFATTDNKLTDAMLADLLAGPFAGRAFSLHRTDPTTGRKDRINVQNEP